MAKINKLTEIEDDFLDRVAKVEDFLTQIKIIDAIGSRRVLMSNVPVKNEKIRPVHPISADIKCPLAKDTKGETWHTKLRSLCDECREKIDPTAYLYEYLGVSYYHQVVPRHWH